MIIGSIYLTKKARKAYRKHQAEKAAQRLTEAVSIEDPSSELNLKVPPSSPTGSQLSLTSSPDTESPSSVFSVRNVRASRSSSDLRSPSSQYSSYSNTASGVKEFEHFVRRQSNDYLHQGSDQPPDYDTVVSTLASPQGQYDGPLASDPQSAVSAGSAHPSWSSHQNLHRHCPTCFAILKHHQEYEHSGNHPIWPPTHNQSQCDFNASVHLQSRPTIPTIPEMPDPSVYQRFQLAGPSRPISEAPDTGTYASEESTRDVKAIAAVELPAEVPPGVSYVSPVHTDEKHQQTDEVNGLGATRELPG